MRLETLDHTKDDEIHCILLTSELDLLKEKRKTSFPSLNSRPVEEKGPFTRKKKKEIFVDRIKCDRQEGEVNFLGTPV